VRLLGLVRAPWRDSAHPPPELPLGPGQPAGTLKVALAHGIGRTCILPLLEQFVQRHPAVVPDLHFDNRQVDLVAEGFDVAIGGGIELSEGVIARELAQVRIVLAAAPSYLREHPAPDEPGGLARHRGVVRRSLESGRVLPWILRNGAGKEVFAAVRPVAVMDDPEAMARAAASGMGIALLPLPHALPLLDSGELVRVMPRWDGGTRALSIYYTSRKQVPAKTRLFIEFIVDGFRRSGQAQRFEGATG
jgi:DNA-binding transcriptional LysR family regulator